MKWLQAFNTSGESTTLAQLNPGIEAAAGVFNPPVDGIIRRIALFVGGDSAITLVEDVRVELQSTDWVPNTMEFVASGVGLRTAPAQHIPAYEYECELPMRTSLGIRGDYIHASGVPVASHLVVLFGYD